MRSIGRGENGVEMNNTHVSQVSIICKECPLTYVQTTKGN